MLDIHNCVMATSNNTYYDCRSTYTHHVLHKTTYNDPFFTARAPLYPICLQAMSPVARLNGLSHKEPIPTTARVPLAPPPPVNSTAPYNGTFQSVAGIQKLQILQYVCQFDNYCIYTLCDKLTAGEMDLQGT